jgi:hypothetical protein
MKENMSLQFLLFLLIKLFFLKEKFGYKIDKMGDVSEVGNTEEVFREI